MQEQCYDVCITSGLLWTFQKPTYNTKPGTTCCVFIKTCKSFHPVGCVISPINETFNNLVTFNFWVNYPFKILKFECIFKYLSAINFFFY